MRSVWAFINWIKTAWDWTAFVDAALAALQSKLGISVVSSLGAMLYGAWAEATGVQIALMGLLVFCSIHLFFILRTLKVRKPSLPIRISQIPEPSYRRYSGFFIDVSHADEKGEKKVTQVDPPQLQIGEIFISNASLTKSVTLRIFLVITDKDGKTHKRHGDGRGPFGHVLGHADFLTTTHAKRRLPPPNYILSPVAIPPQTTVRGSLHFIITEFQGICDGGPSERFDNGLIAYYVRGSTFGKPEERFKYALELEDLISGTIISFPLPSAGYRGDVV
jgi:hypothetical protein